MKKKQLHISADYEAVFRSMPFSGLLIMPDEPLFTIIEISNSYLASSRRQREDLVGKGFFDVYPNQSLKELLESMKQSFYRIISTRQPDTIAFQKFTIPVQGAKNGETEERYVHLKNMPVMDAEGNVSCIVITFEDATAFKRLEMRGNEAVIVAEEQSKFIEENQSRINAILEALLRYTVMDFSERIHISDKNDELDAIVIGLNSLIDELETRMSNLNKANKDLEYANRELDSFSYSVSHDLRAPLRAIHGYSQVLVEDFGDQLGNDGHKVIEVIMRNATRMSALIDDLLTFSKIGKQDLTTVPLNMNLLFSTAVSELVDEEKSHRCDLTIGELENVDGDGSMMKQVVTNLLSNAIKYSGKKERSVIEIGCYRQGDLVVYFIKDNGAGFDMTYYQKLFGVFQRLHNGNDFEGTGVGLALVQRIVKKHKGDVWAEGIPGVGATFYFSMPANK